LPVQVLPSPSSRHFGGMNAAFTRVLLIGTILLAGLTPALAQGKTFSVVDFGAKGDGVTDDTIAIRQAMAAAADWADANTPEVATIYFPAGTYAVAPRETDPGWSKNKPATFEVPTDNLAFIGDGPTQSIISVYTLGLADPNTNWTVIDAAAGYFKIKRGSAFKFPSYSTVRNIRFEGLRITGNCEATGNPAVGGTFRRLSSKDNLLSHYSGNSKKGDVLKAHGLSDGTLLRFGSNENQPAEIISQKAYYVVNATEMTFQVAETPGGAPIAISDSVDSAHHRFNVTDGDGWNMGHSAMDLGAQPFEGLVIENCHLDRWRGEIIHAGGDLAKTIIIRNSLVEHCNASMISVPSLILEDSTVRFGYNGIENYARQEWHTAEVRRCTFEASPDRRYAEGNAMVFLGSPSTNAVFEDNTIINWYRGIYLAEVASNINIWRNDIKDVKTSIFIGRLRLYNDPWTGFDNINIQDNDFRTTRGADQAIMVQYGQDVSNRNLTIHGNTLHMPEDSGRWGRLIYDVSGSSMANREGYRIYNNQLLGNTMGANFNGSIRALWSGNTRGELWVAGSRVRAFDYTWKEGEIEEVQFDSDQFSLENNTSTEFVPATLAPFVRGKYPEGYLVELISPRTNSWYLVADPEWNHFTSNVYVTKDNPVWLIVGADGKFDLLNKPEPFVPSVPEAFNPEMGLEAAELSWEPVAGATSYEVQIAPMGEAFTADSLLLTVDASQTSVVLDGIENGTYSMRIRAENEGLYSDWSTAVEFEYAAEEVLTPVHFWSFDFTENGAFPDFGLNPLPIESGEVVGTMGIGSTNTGIRFWGDHKGLRVPDSETINDGTQSTYTVSIWVRPDAASLSNTSVIYEQGGYWRGLNLLLDRGFVQANGWNRPANESDWQGTTLKGGRLNQGEWNHIALVLNAGESVTDASFEVYVNGSLADSGAGSQLWTQGDDNGIGQVQGTTVYLGRQVRQLNPLQAELDDLTIWQEALTTDEIHQLILSSVDH
jgi:hypothetical protein